MSVRPDLSYAPTHEWLRVEGGEGVVGITHFAQEQLGDITFVDLPKVGAKLAKGQEMGAVESVKAASDIYSPAAGEVIAVNEALANSPEIINQSPYENGWMIRLKLSGTPEGLLDKAGYEAVMAAESH